jgi:hypothetical protein
MTRKLMAWTRLRSTFGIMLSCLLAAGGTLAVSDSSRGAQRPVRTPPAARPSPEAPAAAVPFHAGEKLAFRVLWSKFSVNAGNLELSVVERRNFFGRVAWHFQATAHSMDTMRIIYALDDQFDSYTDAVRLTSLQYEMYLHEQSKQQNGSWRMSSADNPSLPGDVTIAQVPPGTRDPIGLLYALRAADWKREPEFHAPVFDGRNLYEVTARLEQPSGKVIVSAGQFTASQINIRVFQHGAELDGTRFSLWLAQDAAHTPVLIEAEVPVGTARIELMGP